MSRSEPTRRFHLQSAVRASLARVDPGEARALIERGGLLVDVRRRDDPLVSLAGSWQIPPDEIPARLEALREGAPVVLACG